MGHEQRTPDLSAVLQEIVDQSTWVSGSALTLLVTGTGQRIAASYEAAPALAAGDVGDDDPNSGAALIKRLVGTWKSNRELTLIEMDASDLVTSEDRAMFEATLGNVTTKYTTVEFTTLIGGEKTVMPYRALASDDGIVVIEYFDSSTHSMRRRRIRVLDDQLEVSVPGLGFSEVFTRVEAPAAPPASSTP